MDHKIQNNKHSLSFEELIDQFQDEDEDGDTIKTNEGDDEEDLTSGFQG